MKSADLQSLLLFPLSRGVDVSTIEQREEEREREREREREVLSDTEAA